MTDKEHLKQMSSLFEDFERAAFRDPYDPVAYHNAISRILQAHGAWYRSRRRCPWGMIFFCLFLLFSLALLVWAILF